jgi:hypothetical protein
VTNGGPTSRDVGVAWGPSWEEISSSRLAIDGDRDNPARVGGNVSWLAEDTIVVFVQRGWAPNISVEVRTADPRSPYRLSRPIQIYDGTLWGEHTKFVTAFLDIDRRTWFLYRSTWEGTIVLHLAPFGEPDNTPPSAPTDVAAAEDPAGITLTWSAADDPDSGVAGYRIYRDGVFITKVMGTSYTDSAAAHLGKHIYAVSAENLHGATGPKARAQTSPVRLKDRHPSPSH